MSHDHPVIQHLQGLLGGTIPMAQQNPAETPAAGPYTDRAIPMEAGSLGTSPKSPPSSIAKTPGGFAGTSPVELGGMTNLNPGAPMQVSGGGQGATPSAGMNIGDILAKFSPTSGMPGVPATGPQPVQPRPTPAPTQPGNFNYMSVLKNTQQAMPQRDQWMTGGLY